MNYLTIIAAIWTVCAICAVLFIRGATLRDQKPVRVQSRLRRVASKDVSRTA